MRPRQLCLRPEPRRPSTPRGGQARWFSWPSGALSATSLSANADPPLRTDTPPAAGRSRRWGEATLPAGFSLGHPVLGPTPVGDFSPELTSLCDTSCSTPLPAGRRLSSRADGVPTAPTPRGHCRRAAQPQAQEPQATADRKYLGPAVPRGTGAHAPACPAGRGCPRQVTQVRWIKESRLGHLTLALSRDPSPCT